MIIRQSQARGLARTGEVGQEAEEDGGRGQRGGCTREEMGRKRKVYKGIGLRED